jgi:hypothetical protein
MGFSFPDFMFQIISKKGCNRHFPIFQHTPNQTHLPVGQIILHTVQPPLLNQWTLPETPDSLVPVCIHKGYIRIGLAPSRWRQTK